MLTADMVEDRSRSVNPQRWRARVCAAGAVLLLAGCSTFSRYPDGMEQTTLASLRTGKKTGYSRTFEKRTQGRDQVLFALEMGRVAQLEGDFSASRAAFEKAGAAMQAQDDKAVVSASGAAAQGAAVLVNDKAIPYRAQPYERTLLHHYQALNFLATNDLIGAGVEVRRANREQETARQRHDQELAKAKAEDPAAPDEARDPQLGAVYAGLDELAGDVKFSFQNAATFYLSAMVWEMLGERNDAYIDYKQALEIHPENPFLQQDVVRLGKRLGMREDVEDFAKRFPAAAATPADGDGTLQGKARLVVFYEEGLAPQKTEISVAYPLSSANSLGVIALPGYTAVPPPPVPVEVSASGRSLGRTVPICNVSALAARALGEQMPGILTRQVARAVTKAVATKAAHDQGGEFAELAATLYNLFSEQADLRSWLTLPAHIQVLSAWVEPGVRAVTLAAPGSGTLWTEKVTLTANKTTLIHVTRIDLAVYSQVSVQP